MLQFSKKRAAVFVSKCIKSAVANYQEQNTAPGRPALFVSEARVDGGPDHQALPAQGPRQGAPDPETHQSSRGERRRARLLKEQSWVKK
jgi:hypothetical protein